MTSEIYVFGHLNPDTDSICSAIGYAELKKKMGYKNVTPYRLGKISKETQFILDYFGVEEPKLLTDVKARIKDLDIYEPTKLCKTDPIKKAWDMLEIGKDSNASRIVPIVNSDGILEGIVSLGDIVKIFSSAYEGEFSKQYKVRFDNLIEILDGKLVRGEYDPTSICRNLYIGSRFLLNHNKTDEFAKNDIIITGQVDVANLITDDINCGCVILTEGMSANEVTNKNIPVICVQHSMLKTTSLINQAITIQSVMRRNGIITFSNESCIEDVMEIMKTSTHRNFPVIDRNGKFIGVVSRRHLIKHKNKQVILIDHNERGQSVEGLEEARILEVIDHHRVADIQTEAPLYIRAEPVGCTATIVSKIYTENDKKIDKNIAGILLSAILSDTLMFNSPTCTEDDKVAAHMLAKIAEVNIEEYGRKMFGASTSMEDYTPEEIIGLDVKQFTIGKYLVYISQVNTLDFSSVISRKDKLLEIMEEFKENAHADLVVLMITDIVSAGSEILVTNKARELTSQAFGISYEENSKFLEGVVSRKKQVVPRLNQASLII